MISNVISLINNFMYGKLLIILLLLGGIYFTFRTRFVQFRLMGRAFDSLMEKPEDGDGNVSSFQALMVSTASRVGTGNIVGVSTAICLGGFGSVFWMWVIAIIGGASAFIESTLAQIYKKRGLSGSYGGPAYYIEAALHNRPLALAFSAFLILTYGFGFNMLASYNLQSTFSSYRFYDPAWSPWIIGLILAVIVGYCLLGGGRRILKVTSVMVPVMGVLYILVALAVIVLNVRFLPAVLQRIFSEAFNVQAIFSGFSGSCVMYGIKRGLFSNEAGVGSAPNASASADVTHPVAQGLVQVLSVFIDTLLLCSATAFMCMCSGIEPSEALSGAPYVQAALQQTFGAVGPVFITLSMILFAFTTLLGNLYYVDNVLAYMFGHVPGRRFMTVYRMIASLVIFIGAGLNAGLLWDIADVTMGCMTIINMPVILILSKYAMKALKDYEQQAENGRKPVFHVRDIGLPHEVDYWD
ncbi:alanine/glycine:cation symporter family protein [Lacrimispora sp. 210928-DFI.3.58]|uniref:alanine/glycine:cation symporter family protein n=1 Tax=Lacrimispora sp. 210928-DFI.3.58 TaxID=2883214 RepID=UPI001D086E1C|nr:alanine/glycine:cation symporter family protein [Lacrimispora sp. 210928-DFI.3.58]MCB7318933.1 alanine:cation symporter family protein [Lacrimispora sp. 210928-DFI.3.58]